jgi:tRNA ligase
MPIGESFSSSTSISLISRNNHIDKHYNELADLRNSRDLQAYNVRLIAILWDVEKQPYHRMLRICSERVKDRGDNHQTLRPDLTAEAEHEAVVSKFIRDFVDPDESKFDAIVDVSLTDTPEQTIRRIVTDLSVSLGLPSVDNEQIPSALDSARGYKSTTPYHPPAKVGRAIRYFGLAPEIDLAGIVEVAIYYMRPDLAQSAQRFLFALQAKERVITKPHITLVHETNVAEEKAAQGGEAGIQARAWDDCVRLAGQTSSVMWDFEMTHVVWDGRVMAIVVEKLEPQTKEGMDSLAKLVLEETKDGVHITVGTKEEDIRPYEARPLVEMVRKRILAGELDGETEEFVEGGGKVRWAQLGPTKGEGRVKGMW